MENKEQKFDLKNKIKNLFQNWLLKVSKLGTKKIIINIIISFSLVLFLVLVDQITKNAIFSNEDFHNRQWVEGKTLLDYKVIGFRPLIHYGVTSGLDKIFGFVFIHIFSILLLLLVGYYLVFSRKYYLIVFLAFLWSGTFGNMIDRFINNNGVKDIIYIPWRDNGTFNFADLFIAFGSIGTSISVLYLVFFENKNKKN